MGHPRPWFSCVRFSAAIVSSWLVVVHFVSPGGGSPVAAQSSKFSQSTSVFVSAWQQTFAYYDKTFPVPRFVPFEGSRAGTGCGTITANNAYFCSADNTIYYDVNFLRELRQNAGQMTGTDGDYAPIAAVGHELGHAVLTHLQPYATQRQGWSYRVDGIGQERIADCLSGSSTRSAEAAGLLDRTDLKEALAVMEIVGTPELAAPTLRAWIRLHSELHPAPQVRKDMFRAGYERGAMACGDVSNQLRAPAGRR
jgi:predicted metalloprotease